MPTQPPRNVPPRAAATGATVSRRGVVGVSLGLAALFGVAAPLVGCATPTPAPAPPAVAIPPDLRRAVVDLAGALVAHARLPPPPASGRYPVTIDPWIDSKTGDQIVTTRLMQVEIEALAPGHFPQLEPVAFDAAGLARKPLVLVGGIAPVTGPGSTEPARGRPGAYRIYGVLADLSTGTIASAESVWVLPATVDLTPAAFFRDSPVWMPDESVAAYLRTAAAHPGDPIDPTYMQNLHVQALLTDATAAYDGGRFEPALAAYRAAAALPAGGHQARVYNGLYLTNRALGRPRDAEEAFGALVDYGLAHGRLSVKFLFRPGSTAFDPAHGDSYPMWLREIARRVATDSACLRVTGHTSPTGPAGLNDRLSLARARRIRQELIRLAPALRDRVEARGAGAREPIIGTGRDDATDVLDRRVDFQTQACPRLITASG